MISENSSQNISRKTDIKSFLDLAETLPVIDVRSPSEYNYGHIPGAINIPLFDDKEREAVGIRYKNQGRINAILAGLKLAGPQMYSRLEQALKISAGGKLLVYCWRGGMRSEAMSWLFSLGDIQTEVLEGGYKSYRHYVLANLSINKRIILLGGLTGSGKTEILKYLANTGRKIVDLEGLANHKGSAFGSLDQLHQPSSEHFANLLSERWEKVDHGEPVWIEDESRNIGNIFMPEDFYLNMQNSHSIVLLMDINTRLPRLIKEYSHYSPAELEASIRKISKRLGGDNTRDAVQAVHNGEFAKAIEITLHYYDKAYLFGLKRKPAEKITYIHADEDDIEVNALRILEAADKIEW